MIEALCDVSSLGLLVVAGMLAGGVLNLVIDRYPACLVHGWTVEALEQVGDFEQAARLRASPRPGFIIAWGAACPQCSGAVTRCLNTPLLSGPAHRGRFGCCNRRVPSRYFLVEAITAALWGFGGCVFGIGLELLPILVLTCGLTVLAFIDLEHFMLPDQIVGPLLFTGLLANTQFTFAPALGSSVCGTVAGYLAFWVIRAVHQALARKPDGLGLGDCKLVAAIGAWTGIELLIPTIAIAATGCLLFSLLQLGAGRHGGTVRLAFGPWLATGGLGAVFWGNVLSTL